MSSGFVRTRAKFESTLPASSSEAKRGRFGSREVFALSDLRTRFPDHVTRIGLVIDELMAFKEASFNEADSRLTKVYSSEFAAGLPAPVYASFCLYQSQMIVEKALFPHEGNYTYAFRQLHKGLMIVLLREDEPWQAKMLALEIGYLAAHIAEDVSLKTRYIDKAFELKDKLEDKADAIWQRWQSRKEKDIHDDRVIDYLFVITGLGYTLTDDMYKFCVEGSTVFEGIVSFIGEDEEVFDREFQTWDDESLWPILRRLYFCKKLLAKGQIAKAVALLIPVFALEISSEKGSKLKEECFSLLSEHARYVDPYTYTRELIAYAIHKTAKKENGISFFDIDASCLFRREELWKEPKYKIFGAIVLYLAEQFLLKGYVGAALEAIYSLIMEFPADYKYARREVAWIFLRHAHAIEKSPLEEFSTMICDAFS